MAASRGHRFDRDEALRKLAGEEFDVLVIGAGATGAGVALDAASRACARRSSSATTSPPAPPRCLRR